MMRQLLLLLLLLTTLQYAWRQDGCNFIEAAS